MTDAVWLKRNKLIMACSPSGSGVYFKFGNLSGTLSVGDNGWLSVGDKNKGKGRAAEIGIWNLFINWGRVLYLRLEYLKWFDNWNADEIGVWNLFINWGRMLYLRVG